ncbi:ammonium transporter [Corynebacterium rouxii]|uniref:ammonium transporter n=1 Tax=Corynebacterium rouxii TaxID=2719119 RepID=UPI00313CDAEF
MTNMDIALAAAHTGDAAWMMMCATLVLLMTPALAFFYGGMLGQKSVLNMLMMSYGALAVVAVAYIGWGWSTSFGHHGVAGVFANPFEFFGLHNAVITDDGNIVDGSHGYANAIDIGFQLTFAAIATALISGAIAERVKFGTWLTFVGLWVTLVYCPLVFMVWNDGLLSAAPEGIAAHLFGSHDGRAAIVPIDFAGGSVIEVSSGVSGLVLALVVGKRRSFLRSPQRPHNLPMVMLGAALLWFAWLGFNGGSAFGANGTAALAWMNTTAAGAAGLLGWLGAEHIRDGHATSLGAASGVVAGLVAITPAAGALTPVTSLIMGAIAGVLSAYAVDWKYRLGYDDTLDVVGVHLVSGLWGLIGTGLFAHGQGLLTGGGVDGFKLVIVQMILAIVSLAFVGTMTIIIAVVLLFTMGWRVDRETEATGIDAAVHAETAYDNAGSEFR